MSSTTKKIDSMSSNILEIKKTLSKTEKFLTSRKNAPQITQDQFGELMVLVRETNLRVMDLSKRIDQLELDRKPEETVKKDPVKSSKKKKSANLLISAAIVDPMGEKKLQEILGTALFSQIRTDVLKTKKESDPTFCKTLGKKIWEHVRDTKKNGNKDLYESVRDVLSPIFD